jgi:hypothetical protein
MLRHDDDSDDEADQTNTESSGHGGSVTDYQWKLLYQFVQSQNALKPKNDKGTIVGG